MNINSINYEAFALDYLEGNLPGDLREEMESFLEKHPDIAKEIEEMKGFVILKKKTIVYPRKKLLLKRNREELKSIPLYWRIAVSAAVFLFMMTFYFTTSNKNSLSSTDSIVHETTPNIAAKKKEMVPIPSIDNAVQPILKSTNNVILKEQVTPNQKMAATTFTNRAVIPPHTNNKLPLQKEKSTPNSLNTRTTVHLNKPQSVLPIIRLQGNEISVILPLPSVQTQKIDFNNSFTIPTKILQQLPQLEAVIVASPKKKSLKKLLGKLSIKVEKSSFIPTYFTEEGTGQ